MKVFVHVVFLVFFCTWGSFSLKAQHLSSFSDAFSEDSDYFNSEEQKNLHADLVSSIIPTAYFLDGSFTIPRDGEVEKIIIDLQSAELLDNQNIILNNVVVIVYYVSDINMVSANNSIDVSKYSNLLHVNLIFQSYTEVDAGFVNELLKGASPDLYITYSAETPN